MGKQFSGLVAWQGLGSPLYPALLLARCPQHAALAPAFFSRGESPIEGAYKFFRTIAADLVVRKPATGPRIKDAIEAGWGGVD
jgi:hypothetical protein